MTSYAQLTLLGGEEDAPVLAKIQALHRVRRNADPAWLAAARCAIERLCARLLYFTTDEVWAELEDTPAPHEPRALGAVMRAAAKDGLIEATGKFVVSQRTECHGRPVAVWKVK